MADPVTNSTAPAPTPAPEPTRAPIVPTWSGSASLDVIASEDQGSATPAYAGDAFELSADGQGRFEFRDGNAMRLKFKLADAFDGQGSSILQHKFDVLGEFGLAERAFLSGGVGFDYNRRQNPDYVSCVDFNSDSAEESCGELDPFLLSATPRVSADFSYYRNDRDLGLGLPVFGLTYSRGGLVATTSHALSLSTFLWPEDRFGVSANVNYKAKPGIDGFRDGETINHTVSPELRLVYNIGSAGSDPNQVQSGEGGVAEIVAGYTRVFDREPNDIDASGADSHSFKLRGAYGIMIPWVQDSKGFHKIIAGSSMPLVLGATYTRSDGRFFRDNMLLLDEERPELDESWAEVPQGCGEEGNYGNLSGQECQVQENHDVSNSLSIDVTGRIPFDLITKPSAGAFVRSMNAFVRFETGIVLDGFNKETADDQTQFGFIFGISKDL